MRGRVLPIGVVVCALAMAGGSFAVWSARDASVGASAVVDEIPDRYLELVGGPPRENPDAGEGAKAMREIPWFDPGAVAAAAKGAKGNGVDERPLDAQIADNAGVLRTLQDAGDLDGMIGSSGLDATVSGGIGGLIGSRGSQLGSDGLGARGSGLGRGDGSIGLGGLGTRGEGSGASGYGVGGGGFGSAGAVGYGAVASGEAVVSYAPAPRASVSKDVVDPGRNPLELVERDMLSTFSIDVDTASYTQARRVIRAGRIPSPPSVRTEEFVNFFRYDYPQPEEGRPFSITMDGAEHPFQPGHHLVRVGIQGSRDMNHKPVHLTFLVDVSGSMSGADRLPLAKRALHHLVDGLDADDTVAIAIYAGGTGVVLPPTGAADAYRIHQAIDGLRNGGGTAMESGMKLAYDMALEARVPGEENRVIVLSDGDANIGATSHQQILDAIAGYAKQGITLSTVGFGVGNYRDNLMEQLADKGDGNYSYIDGPDEAMRVFGEDLGATLRTIARDVKIQVAFDPDAVIAYTLIGYENRAIADEDFRNDKVDAGEVGAGHTVTALYDVILRDEASGPLAEVQVRYKPPGPDAPSKEVAVSLPARSADIPFDRASRDLARAFAVSAVAEKLRESEALAEIDWDRIAGVVRTAMRQRDDRDAELVDLVERIRGMARKREAVVATAVVADAGIAEVIQRSQNQIRYCYQRELTRDPGLQGELTVAFTIDDDGSVREAEALASSLASSAVESCVTGRFMRMQFPRAEDGGARRVSYPLRFDPT